MRNILLLGAGKSSIVLIDYLVKHAAKENWELTVADITAENAWLKTKGRKHTKAVGIDLNKLKERKSLIAAADIVVSMLPAALHLTIAKDCLSLKKNLVTPSYISDEMKALNKQVETAGLIFMNEMGLDPGIDHMSSMKMIDGLKAAGKKIIGYESHCGGLVAPKNDDNPWHYKFTWNPRNVILAGKGKGGIRYLKNGGKVTVKYEDLFAGATKLKLDGHGTFESYPNRDSLKYISEYGLDDVKTMYRGTLRVPPFCRGWNLFVKLGLTTDKEFDTQKFIAVHSKVLSNIEKKMTHLDDDLLISTAYLVNLLLNKDKKINPAQFLQSVLEERWKMKPSDKDMIVMVHQIKYSEGKKTKQLQSSLVYIGKDAEHTAMATTVGLPVAIVTKMILNNNIKRKGVLMPKYPEIYNPILAELEKNGIAFKESISKKITGHK